MNRCHFVGNDEVYIAYHDNEWCKESHDEHYLYEMFLLETFQAGLSWITILKKREAFRKAFDNFDVLKIAQYNETKYNQLMNNKDIIRNSRKIKAAISNAKIFIEIQKEYQTFDNYIWSFSDNKVIYRKSKKDIVSSSLSDEISTDLKKRGMSFVGTITIYSYLQAIGIVNDHEEGCFLHQKRQH